MQKLLEVQNLSVGFKTDSSTIKAIDSIDFELSQGETICIVGESGSGKSVTSLAIMKLIEYENGIYLGGDIKFEGNSILQKSVEEIRGIRGKEISMIFQEPMSALNPVMKIGKQIIECIRIHQDLSKEDCKKRALELLNLVGVSDPTKRLEQFPHELSGGMRQRIMIAMALSCNPKLLIADEPTTALDVTIESQILSLLGRLKEELNMSIILITHDMGVAAEMADKIIVMYAGRVIEIGNVFEIFDKPLHPYTKGLLDSIPKIGRREEELPSIPGSIPSLLSLPQGCRYNTRCPYAVEKCFIEEPDLKELSGRRVACWLPGVTNGGVLHE